MVLLRPLGRQESLAEFTLNGYEIP